MIEVTEHEFNLFLSDFKTLHYQKVRWSSPVVDNYFDDNMVLVGKITDSYGEYPKTFEVKNYEKISTTQN